MLEVLVLSGCLNLNIPTPFNKDVRKLLAGLLVAAPAFSSRETSSFTTPLGIYEYDLVYTHLNIADVYLKFKQFEANDLPECARTSELLQRILADNQSQLYTMEFGFNV